MYIFGRYCIYNHSRLNFWTLLVVIDQTQNKPFLYLVCFALEMGGKRGNKNKNKGSRLKAQDFLKTGLNDTNNDSTENSSQLDNPQTINSSTNS